MKRLLSLFVMLILAGVLVACSGDNNNNAANADTENNGDANAEENDVNGNSTDSDDATDDGDLPEDENYDQVFDMLESEGYELGEKEEGFKEDFGADSAITVVLNGEDALPLQIYKMPEDSENLEQAHETGEMTMEYEGQEGQIPVLAIDNYCFFLDEGHPDVDDVYQLIEDNFEPTE